jgi:hypothetical protein
MNKIIQGIGVNDFYDKVTTKRINNKEYSLWTSMLLRCYSEHKRETYIGCEVSNNFKSYTFFYEWCQTQSSFNIKDNQGKCWHLDKDLLTKGNKLYSEDTCVFVPQQINALLTKRQNLRGCYPVGTSLNKKSGKFQANCKNGNGKLIYLGLHDTPEQAFQAYKTFKEALIKGVAEKYKLNLDPRAYEALMNYQVEITD